MVNTTMMNTNFESTMTPKMNKTDALNQILRGERSAVEAYRQVMDKIVEKPEKIRLKEFLASHQRNVEYWERQVQAEAEQPDATSGPWGYVVKTFVGTAKLFGDSVTLTALRQGEEHGLSEYKSLIENPQIDELDKRHVRNVIIPDLERHVASIEAMKKMH